jgi:hypothetical protein
VGVASRSDGGVGSAAVGFELTGFDFDSGRGVDGALS